MKTTYPSFQQARIGETIGHIEPPPLTPNTIVCITLRSDGFHCRDRVGFSHPLDAKQAAHLFTTRPDVRFTVDCDLGVRSLGKAVSK